MKRSGVFFGKVSPVQALVDGWLVCAVLLMPLFPVVLPAPPLPRSLYLVLLPLVCAAVSGLRMRFFLGIEEQGRQIKAEEGGFLKNVTAFIHLHPRAVVLLAVVKECFLAAILALGILGVVLGLLAAAGQLAAIRRSYAGTEATIFFLLMAAPEYLAVRFVVWTGQHWNRLRRRRYAWALTHAILVVVGILGVLILFGIALRLAAVFGTDIWGIPPESAFAKAVFWLSLLTVLGCMLFVGGLALLLPPTVLFSFLVARKMTARVESLVAATQALRSGDLARRVAVQGEDEIAQLQADFNAMAADLEQSVQALQAEKDKVWQLMEARRELVAGVSHELRNPAAIILGFSDALRRSWQARSAQEVTQDLESIQYEAARLQTILDDLLAASQVEAGRLQVGQQAVDVNALAGRLVETFARLAWGSQRVQVSLAAPPERVLALADPLRLEQVLINLMQNAVRHTSPGGLVAVEIHPGAEQIWIEVEDTGEGIPAEDLPHIWEKYYQSGSAQPRGEYGMGLGLALVKELTEAMGGTVAVESQVGQGSLFRVYLPACPEKVSLNHHDPTAQP